MSDEQRLAELKEKGVVGLKLNKIPSEVEMVGLLGKIANGFTDLAETVNN